jgi:hypothetical protein
MLATVHVCSTFDFIFVGSAQWNCIRICVKMRFNYWVGLTTMYASYNGIKSNLHLGRLRFAGRFSLKICYAGGSSSWSIFLELDTRPILILISRECLVLPRAFAHIVVTVGDRFV